MPNAITPEEIREIRSALRLTQAEAGAVLGGGPRAFAKYEAGTVEPSAGLVKLLRLLDGNPAAITAVGGRRREPNLTLADAPFMATGADVMRLREWELPQFLRSLLHAEAEANGLAADDIHVAEDYFVADGGEDAHLRWDDGPSRTPHLPARYTQFQIKTGNITLTNAATEPLTKDRHVKPMIRSALEAGAHYVLLCTTSLTAQKASAIADRIRTSLRKAGLPVVPERIHVQDAEQLAAWTNNYPPIVARVKERTAPNSTGPFRSWIQWANRTEHVLSPFAEDERLPELKSRLVNDLARPGTVVRVLGPAGVGKSRLVLESLYSLDAQGLPMHEFVMYADQSEAEQTAICGAVRTLADTGARAIVVVDDCPPDTHQRLAGMVAAPRSRLSLATIDNDEAHSASAQEKSTVPVRHAPRAVTEIIIDRELPSLSSEDRRRLLLFSRGYPTIAVRIASAWAQNKPMPYSTDDYFVNAFVTGRNDPEPDVTIRTAMLIAAFGTVRHTPHDSEVADLALWGRRITPGDMHAALDRLIDRGVIQRRGGLVVLQPRPVAMRLTERQWREWTPDRRLGLLTGDRDPHFKRNVARQLAWINDTNVAKEVAAAVLRPDGPLDGLHRLAQPGNPGVLYQLAAVDAQLAADCIRRTLDGVADLRALPAEVRRFLVQTLETVAFPPNTFADAASLLLRLAVAETEDRIANNATGQFAALFPMIEGATAADGASRIALLREAGNTNDPRQRAVVVNALLAGAKTMYFSRFVGAETHGSRPALQPWRPLTGENASDYVTFCVEQLAREATAGDDVGVAAKTGLGHELRALVAFGLLNIVENVVARMRDATGSWSEATESLGDFIQFDAADAAPCVPDRVRALIRLLQPTTLSERIHDLVSNMPWDYPNGEDLDYDQQVARQLEAVEEVAQDVLRQTPVLAEHLPHLCHGSQRWACVFGERIGARIDSPEDWLQRIATVLRQLPDDDRNFDLLSGFVKGLSERDPDAVETCKRQVAESTDLAPALPSICSRLGLVDSDIQLAIVALRAGVLPPWPLRHWAMGGVLSALPPGSLAPLFDELRGHGTEGLLVATELLGMLSHGAQQRLEDLRPQLIELATSIVGSELTRQSAMVAHHLKTIFKWLLAKGRGDRDALTLALTVSRAMAAEQVSRHTLDLLSPLLPDLLSGFPEIAWPLIGQRMLEPTISAWQLRRVLTGASSRARGDAEPPILSLPPDTLFAWCAAYPHEAPVCAAGVLPILAPDDAESNALSLHPLLLRLLDQFGDRKDVLDAADANIHSFIWVGSLTTYFARYRGPLATLRDHPIPRVARWANRMGLQLDREIAQAQAHDDEHQADSEV